MKLWELDSPYLLDFLPVKLLCVWSPGSPDSPGRPGPPGFPGLNTTGGGSVVWCLCFVVSMWADSLGSQQFGCCAGPPGPPGPKGQKGGPERKFSSILPVVSSQQAVRQSLNVNGDQCDSACASGSGFPLGPGGGSAERCLGNRLHDQL